MADARRTLVAVFRAAGIASADLDARVLTCAAAGIDHAALIRDPEAALGEGSSSLRAFAERRLAGEPVSRIAGFREFWGLAFSIDSAVLDPRPETEVLVGTVLDALDCRTAAELAILDLGTGSGAILCALLTAMPRATGFGVDRAPGACVTARRNIRSLGLAHRARVVCGSWADGLSGRFDAVVSNPPYVRRAEIAGLAAEVRNHDPAEALDGGVDGLDAYRLLVPETGRLLHRDGVAAFECGLGQGAAIDAMMREAGLRDVRVVADLAGIDRVVIGRRR